MSSYSFRDFLKGLKCSNCCKDNNIIREGQNINLSIDIKKDKIIVKDEEIQKNNTPSTPISNNNI